MVDPIENAKNELSERGFYLKSIYAEHNDVTQIAISRTSTHIDGIGDVISGDIRLLTFDEDGDQTWKLESHDGVIKATTNLSDMLDFIETDL